MNNENTLERLFEDEYERRQFMHDYWLMSEEADHLFEGHGE